MKRTFWYAILFLILLFAGGGWLFLATLGESEKPLIRAGEDSVLIGLQKVLKVTFSDEGRGLSHAEMTLIQNNQPRLLASLDFPETGIREKSLSITVDAVALKLQDGPATLTFTAVDHSLWKNKNTLTLPVTIDLMPPQISQFNPINHINPGGACVVTYRLSEAPLQTGVQVGEIFYPAYPITLSGKSSFVAYFALPLEAVQGNPRISILARDRAGNETVGSVPTLILKRRFRSDKMALSDGFLGRKMPEFQAANPSLRGKTPMETFAYVNTVLREENTKTIQSICRQSEPKQLWEGVFSRMKNAAPMALFGDRRTYFYNDKPVGKSIHEGVDLASLANAQIEAANAGIVLFTGPLGIYGNSVIIDHGLGLATMYAHMSAIRAKPKQVVKKGDIIGVSGASGLAGGDHLHFGVALNGQFVDPREWWDAHWIEDNVAKKMAVAF
jgi:murein DD-endopeptidase MepM/ murein hydrolase activator NlpD